MGRQSKLKKLRKADPTRAERVQAMLQSERQLRETLDRVLKMGKELGDHMHYDRLGTDVETRAKELLKEITDLIEHERVKVLEQCFTANYDLRRECESLGDELDKLEGRAARPDPLEGEESLLAQLPPKQAAALRLVAAQSRLPAPPAPEATDAFERGKDFLERLTARVSELRRETATLLEVTEEKVRRGWAARSEVDSRKPDRERFLSQIEAAVPPVREFVETALAEYHLQLQRRARLRQAIARHRSQ